jgi:hypothetical protein
MYCSAESDLMDDAYWKLGQALHDAKVKYAYVVFEDLKVIEIGDRFTRTSQDLIGSDVQPQS